MPQLQPQVICPAFSLQYKLATISRCVPAEIFGPYITLAETALSIGLASLPD